jgi:pimeloyl-ACP methyl ester carboxylesterase
MKLIKSLALRSLFIFVLFLSSFAGSALPVPLSRISTIRILQQLGGVPCPNDSIFTCVTVNVPLDHFNPADTRTIPVTFAVHPATGIRRGIFAVATGGPGTAGISLADSYSSGYRPVIMRRFDVVFFDQRGVGLSGGLSCPQAAVKYYEHDGQSATPEQKQALAAGARTFAEDCVNELSNPEILPYLGTAQAIEDLEYFRQLMQDNKFWLYGESYGTQYAQTYAAKYGSHLAGLILDGTVDLTLTGFEYYAQQAQAFNNTLTDTMQFCNDDPYCIEDVATNLLEHHPDLTDISDSLVEIYDYGQNVLKGAPAPYDFPLPQGGFAQRQFSFADLEVVAAGQMYTEADRMMLDRAMASSLAYDSITPLARLLYLNLGVDPQTLDVIVDPSYSDALFYAVECQDYGYPGATPEEKAMNYFEAGDQIVPGIPRLGSIFYGDLPCAFWPNATTDLTRPEPLIAAGIPTLVLNGTADPATPISNALSVYGRLRNGYLITQQGGPHVIFGWGNACPDNQVTNFLVYGRVPARRVTRCPGVTVDDYVPISPVDANEFVNVLDALSWTETEISYLPEYYYWDGYTPTSVGCPLGGTLAFEPNDLGYPTYNLNGCAFANGFIMTGTGLYNFDIDRFNLNISTHGRWECTIRYTRIGVRTRLTSTCAGTTATLQGKTLLPVENGQFPRPAILSKNK